MAESISIRNDASKVEKYEQLIPQIKALVGNETNRIAIMANVASAIHEAFGFLWTGFYLLEADELVLGPFQGPVACMRIKVGRGVSGAVLERNETLVVPDVDQFPGHIACSNYSRSEIVVPIRNRQGEICAVLDVDSEQLATYDLDDKKYLEEICNWVGEQAF
jgi:GAF domain-containing protein